MVHSGMRLSPDFFARATVVLSILLIASLVLFIGVQFWYLYVESDTTKKLIQETSRSYDDRISELGGGATPEALESHSAIVRLSFLKEFKNQQVWEWSHERTNRRYVTFLSIAEWFVQLLVLFLAILNERIALQGEQLVYGLKRSTTLLLVFFAVLAIALPAATQKLGFDARQRLHDFRAQQLGFLIVGLESGITSPELAWFRFQALYQESPSSFAERPGL